MAANRWIYVNAQAGRLLIGLAGGEFKPTPLDIESIRKQTRLRHFEVFDSEALHIRTNGQVLQIFVREDRLE